MPLNNNNKLQIINFVILLRMNKGDVRLICYFYDQSTSSLQMSLLLKDQRQHCDSAKETV